MNIIDTSNLEPYYNIIEPDGSITGPYKSFYTAMYDMLTWPVISDLLLTEMVESGVDINSEDPFCRGISDWLFSNGEEFINDHGYSLQRIFVKK